MTYVMLAFFLSPVEALVAYCIWCLYRLAQFGHFKPVRRIGTTPKSTCPEWTANEEGYLEIRSMYCNLRYQGEEWDQERKEVLVGIGMNGFDVLGDEPVFTGISGAYDEIAFYDGSCDTDEVRFTLTRTQAKKLVPYQCLVVTGSI